MKHRRVCLLGFVDDDNCVPFTHSHVVLQQLRQILPAISLVQFIAPAVHSDKKDITSTNKFDTVGTCKTNEAVTRLALTGSPTFPGRLLG
jgi:hypothetical protein